MNALTKEAVGYETYGYWPWHNAEEAAKDCEDHVSLPGTNRLASSLVLRQYSRHLSSV